MSPLMVAVLIAAAPVEDPLGFRFTVPDGFEPFPGFKPTATKRHAFGKNLGTTNALTLTVDVLEGPATPGASRSCSALANSIERTVSSPSPEAWQGDPLSGARLVMTHVFGDVLVFCVDVPLQPNGLSLMISGKPQNEAILHDTFRAVLASVRDGHGQGGHFAPISLAVVVLFALVVAFSRKLRRRGRGK